MGGAHGPTYLAPRVARMLAPILFATAIVAVGALPARSGLDTFDDGQKNQQELDQPAPDDAQFGQWGDLDGGVADRPFVLALSVTNGATTTQVISNGTTTPPTTSPGDVTATIEPYNLCTAAQVPGVDPCYATPNRISVSVVYAKAEQVGMNFAAPTETVTPVVGPNSIIDLTLALNTLGESLRWTWINGDLLYWQTTDLGSPGATLRVRFRPAYRPWFENPRDPETGRGDYDGCSASPPTDCPVMQADRELLAAQLVLSLDDSLPSALTGAAFATQNALFGYLEPGGDENGPLLTVRASSTHLRSDGSDQLGTVQAFLPSAAMMNLFGVLPADAASVFSIARSSDDGGTNGTPTYATWTAATNGSDGLFITVPDVTFSVPTYDVSQSLWFTSGAQIRGRKTTINLQMLDPSLCTSARPCTASIYDLGEDTAPRYSTSPLVAQARFSGGTSIAVTGLAKDHLYLIYLTRARGPAKGLASSIGYVCPVRGGNPEACG